MIEGNKENLVERIYCRECGIMYTPMDKSNVCPKCQEKNYFNCIREYIDEEKPTVDKLSDELRVPKVKIYRWIRDGRVQFIPGTGVTGIYCEICGIPITAGAMCIECAKREHKKRNNKVIAIGAEALESAGKIRADFNK
ncbi:MAG: hypothetical protein E7277_09540 [Lachnospiraceae bacterium]|nr:hypothetical protein [Lachnospiraceae bacterium]